MVYAIGCCANVGVSPIVVAIVVAIVVKIVFLPFIIFYLPYG